MELGPPAWPATRRPRLIDRLPYGWDHDRYLAYLQSDDWALQRAAAFARARMQCQRCGSRYGLEVHHRTYARLGDERPDDLELLCGDCHERHHRRQREAKHSSARLDSWATKVYGEDWDLHHDVDRVEEEFDEWLDRQPED